MKKWNNPEITELNISETAGNNHQNGNTHGKTCVYDSTQECNAQGNGKGICNNCIFNPNSPSVNGSTSGSETDMAS